MFDRRMIALGAAILAAGCRTASVSGRAPRDGNPGAGGNGGSSDGGEGGAGGGATTDGGPVPDAGGDRGVSWDGGGRTCGEKTTPIPYSPKTPDVIIAMDKSGSITWGWADWSDTMPSRYQAERDLLVPLVSMFETRIRWGFEEFPRIGSDASGCAAADVSVAPGLMTAAAVMAAIDVPIGDKRYWTPTADALTRIRDFYKGLADGIKERYVLLSTDGDPTCVPGGPYGTIVCDPAVDAVKALASDGVKTVVLGVGEGAAASACLDRMATAGGAPRAMGPPYFYPAKDADTLKKYLDEIIGGIAKPSCHIDLVSAPPDPSKVAVFFDGKEVPWDPSHKDGWDYDGGSMTRITVYGSYCGRLEGFMVKLIDVRFGCPPCGATAACP